MKIKSPVNIIQFPKASRSFKWNDFSCLMKIRHRKLPYSHQIWLLEHFGVGKLSLLDCITNDANFVK